MTTSHQPHIAILLATYQNATHLPEQLDSIYSQSIDATTDIWVSRDCSSDAMTDTLNQYKDVHVLPGPKKGFCANFLSMLCNDEIKGDYFAFSDQDDIWLNHKMQKAVNALKAYPNDIPKLYCTRTLLINETGKSIGKSPLFAKTPNFSNALIQSIAGGNTMVMNRQAKELLAKVGMVDVVSHDWWAYMLITGAGGKVIYDAEPTVAYRQHGHNIIGSNNSFADRLLRMKMLFKGRFRLWNTKNINALQQHRDLLTPQNQKRLDVFCQARNQWFAPRLWGVLRCGLHRQTILGNLGLVLATFLKKI